MKALKTNVNGEEYVNGTITDNVKEAIKIGGEAGVYIDGGLFAMNFVYCFLFSFPIDVNTQSINSSLNALIC